MMVIIKKIIRSVIHISGCINIVLCVDNRSNFRFSCKYTVFVVFGNCIYLVFQP